jgi:hypothetical protein
MHERVCRKAPNLARPQNARAIEQHEVEDGAPAGSHDQASENGDHNVQGDEHGRDVDREPTHPGNWPIVIGGSDSEHISIIAFGFPSARARKADERRKIQNSSKFNLDDPFPYT